MATAVVTITVRKERDRWGHTWTVSDDGGDFTDTECNYPELASELSWKRHDHYISNNPNITVKVRNV